MKEENNLLEDIASNGEHSLLQGVELLQAIKDIDLDNLTEATDRVVKNTEGITAEISKTTKGLSDKIDEGNKLLKEIKDKPEPKPVEVQKISMEGISVVTLKGEKGDSRTDEEVISLIKPLIPAPIKGDKGDMPTDSKITDLIKPLIPKPIKGDAPTSEQIISLIKPLIPKPIPGRDGSPDTGEDIVRKHKELPEEKRISYDDLSDLPNLEALRRQSSKTTSLVELDDVDLAGVAYVNGKYVLGSGGSSGITVGTTTITGGTDRSILFDNAGVVGENSGFQFDAGGDLIIPNSIHSTSLSAFNLLAHTATVVDTGGSYLYAKAGDGLGTGYGGAVYLYSGGGLQGGDITISAGGGGASRGGNILITGGPSSGSDGGDVIIQSDSLSNLGRIEIKSPQTSGNGVIYIGAEVGNKILMTNHLSYVDGRAMELDFASLTSPRVASFQDASGIIALLSDLSSYVPYTGATGDLDLGANDLIANVITCSEFESLSDLFFTAAGNLSFSSDGGAHRVNITTSNLAADRAFTFPDQDGIIVATPDPGANTIYMWDDTDNLPVNVTIGSGLTYTHATHTLSASGGGGSTVTVGSTTIDFGSTPGTSLVVTTISTAAALTASKIKAFVVGTGTATHNAYEHFIVPLQITCGNIIDGVSFDIYASGPLRLDGTFNVQWEIIT